jgi:hypothetical protein
MRIPSLRHKDFSPRTTHGYNREPTAGAPVTPNLLLRRKIRPIDSTKQGSVGIFFEHDLVPLHRDVLSEGVGNPETLLVDRTLLSVLHTGQVSRGSGYSRRGMGKVVRFQCLRGEGAPSSNLSM